MRLEKLIETGRNDSRAKRLIQRLQRHVHDLFTFLNQQGVPFHDNLSERVIRPAAIIR